MLSSAWLVYKNQQLEHELAGQKQQVNQALSLQKNYQQQLQLKNRLTEPLNEVFPYWNTWPVVLEAISVGAEFSAVHYKSSKVTLHGIADKNIKATDVLVTLSENPNVNSPSFSQPVRKYRNKENFAISFNFATPLLQQKNEQE